MRAPTHRWPITLALICASSTAVCGRPDETRATFRDAAKRLASVQKEIEKVKARIERHEARLKKLDAARSTLDARAAATQVKRRTRPGRLKLLERQAEVLKLSLEAERLRLEKTERDAARETDAEIVKVFAQIVATRRRLVRATETALADVKKEISQAKPPSPPVVDAERARIERERVAERTARGAAEVELRELRFKANELAYVTWVNDLVTARRLDELAPPILRQAEITQAGAVKYSALWKDPETLGSDELAKATQLLKALRDYRRWLEGEIKKSGDVLVSLNKSYLALLKRYATDRYWLVCMRCALALLKGAIKSKGNPAAFGIFALEQVQSAVLNEVLGTRKRWDLPNYPEELLQAIERERGSPVVWARAQLGQDTKGVLSSKTVLGSGESPAALAEVTRWFHKYVDVTRFETHRRLWNAFLPGKDILKALYKPPSEFPDGVEEMLALKNWQKLGRVKMRGVLKSAGIDLAAHLVDRFMTQMRDREFIRAVGVELKMFRAQKRFHLLHAMARRVDDWIATMLQDLYDLLFDRDPWERPIQRALVVSKDDVFGPNAPCALRLTFSRSVRIARVALDGTPLSPLPKASAATHELTFRLHPAYFETKRWAARLSIGAVSPKPDAFPLDGEPGSLAWFRPVVKGKWTNNPVYTDLWTEFSREQPDTTHRLKLKPLGKCVSILFLLDTSSSMRTGNKLGKAKAAVARLVRDPSVSRRAEFSAWSFQRGIQQVHPFTTNAEALIAAVNKLGAHGNTPLSVAIRRAGEALVRTGNAPQKILIVLSDGSNTDTGSVPVAERWVRSLAEGLSVVREGY